MPKSTSDDLWTALDMVKDGNKGNAQVELVVDDVKACLHSGSFKVNVLAAKACLCRIESAAEKVRHAIIRLEERCDTCPRS